jgi:hypothetical protein
MKEQSPESRLRHPLELPVFIGSIVFNIGLMVLAYFVVSLGWDWLKDHPVLAGSAKQIRALAIAAIFAPPAIAVIRNVRRGFVRGNSVRLSRDQVPLIHELLERHCRALNLEKVPDLYLGDRVIRAPAQAFSTFRTDFIVVNPRYIERKPEKSKRVLSFALGREIGRMRLRHTTWWYEMVVAYVINIPYLKNPMTQVQTLSHDRYGAYLEPKPLPGLIILASGRRLLKEIATDDFVRDAREYGGFWALVSNFAQPSPHISYRIKELMKAGLIDPARAEPKESKSSAEADSTPVDAKAAPDSLENAVAPSGGVRGIS